MKKSITSTTSGFGYGNFGGTIDAFNRRREPTPSDLIKELKNTAWTCANIKASTVASFPPELYIQLGPQFPQPMKSFPTTDPSPKFMRKTNDNFQQIHDHPFLRLIRSANPLINQQELLEITTLYQEIFGIAYWYVPRNAFNMPYEIWPFSPAELIPSSQYRKLDPMNLAASYMPEWYDLHTCGGTMRIDPSFVIDFRYPDPKNPYRSGISPMRAAFESISLNSEHIARRMAHEENRARPDAILSPGEVIGPDERDRLEMEFNEKFRRGNTGKIMVTESDMRLMPLAWPSGNEDSLSQHGMTKEDICNAFGVPLSYVTKETNLANLQGSDTLFMGKAIKPLLNRRDQIITEKLLPWYDPMGRLFAFAEDPVPEDIAAKREQEKVDLEHGVLSINEVRKDRKLPPVPWGDLPWLPTYFAPADPNNPNRNVYDRTGYGGYAEPPQTQSRNQAKEKRQSPDQES